MGLYTSRWVTKPIQQIAQASDKMAQGKLHQHVEPSAINEIDTLASSFNSMATQLESSFDALRQSEATNRAIVTAIPDLMIRARGDGTYLEIVGNDRLRGVYGVKRFSAGNTVQESLPPDLAAQRMHYIHQALTTGKLQVYEHRITIDGQAQDEEVRILVLGDDEVLIMVRDITDRKQAEESLRIAEENYRSIFENALEGIFQSSPEGWFIRANPALARMYGYDSPAEMMKSITNIGEQLYVDPEKRSEFRHLLEKQDAVKGFEYRCYCKDGSIIWIQIDARAVRDSSGNLLYYEGIVQDITERKRREDELRRQLEELKIEIDQKKREKEVAMLTESTYFQEVQQEIAEVNLDEFWS
jgi:PAS domain S-box-containing protein